jgi:methylated-DNA-[protein]-cysteine S-methyltransferase
MNTIYYTRMKSRFGPLLVAASAEALCRIEFARGDEVPEGWKRSDRELARIRRQLEQYFAGKRRSFALELAPEGTEFQRLVWYQVGQVPYGTTITYRELASRVGKPQAVRAVGAANGQNPIPIVIPCHRIIGTDGGLRGYGGGLDLKRRLLELEGADAPARPRKPRARAGRSRSPGARGDV